MSTVEKMSDIYDVVGVGVGPSNLALAAAIEENGGLNALFLESKAEFTWHKNMLLEDSEMQVSFLKDIVTMRNPLSQYSFINYLFCHNRLAEFINLKNFYPSRLEFNDYLRWIAYQLKKYINYNSLVVNITTADYDQSTLYRIEKINLINNKLDFIYAKHIVIAVGGTPKIPSCIEIDSTDGRIFHSSEYLYRLKSLSMPNIPRHFCVVGGGQSAAEIVIDLYNKFPGSKITLAHRGFGLKAVDNSWFTNKIYDKPTADIMYRMNQESRYNLTQEYRETNYAAIDVDLIELLGDILYQQLVRKDGRINIKNFSSVSGVDLHQKGVVIKFNDELKKNLEYQIQADILILCTGYEYKNPPDILKGVEQYINKDNFGQPVISQDYCLSLNHKSNLGNIFTQGCNEKTHGLSDTLLSLTAVRAKIIFDQISNAAHVCNDLNIEVLNECRI